jgi:hypothetical protein
MTESRIVYKCPSCQTVYVLGNQYFKQKVIDEWGNKKKVKRSCVSCRKILKKGGGEKRYGSETAEEAGQKER